MWKCKKCGGEITRNVSGTFFGWVCLNKMGDYRYENIVMDDCDDVYDDSLNCDCGYCNDEYDLEEVAVWEEDR